jgi:hypothetical protein
MYEIKMIVLFSKFLERIESSIERNKEISKRETVDETLKSELPI